MASPVAQAQAQALNAKLEGQARIAIDEIEKTHMRKIARASHVCATACYDKAGASGPADALEACVHNCQMPAQQANAYVQSEVNQYQNRLNRAMAECQDRARDLMVPGYEKDAKKLQKVEDALLSCMSRTVEQHIQLLKPMRERIEASLKNLK